MPRFEAGYLEAFCTDILAGAGMRGPDGRMVAAHLVDSELKNVVSHGVNRVPYYLSLFEKDGAKPVADVTATRTDSSVLRVDGGCGLGIPAMERAVNELIDMTRVQPIACAGIFNVSHTGRLGAYAERLARSGKFAMICGGGGRERWRMVAAHGGRGSVLSTNPWALALPACESGCVSADFATCVVANGKIRLRRRTGEAVPEGWLIDREGNPTTSIDDYDDGGAILPAGGHKGYGLAVIAELVGGAMLGPSFEFNWLIIALDTGAFGTAGNYDRDAREIVESLRATPPAPGTDKVRVPGDPERESETLKREAGIELHAEIWQGLVDAARDVGVPVPKIRDAAWTFVAKPAPGDGSGTPASSKSDYTAK